MDFAINGTSAKIAGVPASRGRPPQPKAPAAAAAVPKM